MQRGFKGIWIPAEIWLNESLSALDKIILAEIDSLDNEEGCTAGNAYIANFCQCSESKVSKSIKTLIEAGYVRQVSFDGRRRVLKSCIVKNARQDGINCEADEQKVPTIKINTNKAIKEGRKKEESYDSVIRGYTDNDDLQTELIEFVKMRKMMKKPLTNHGLSLQLKKLDKLASNDQEKIAVVSQSIERGWQAFYELKDYNSGKPTASKPKKGEKRRAKNVEEIMEYWKISRDVAQMAWDRQDDIYSMVEDR